MADDRVMTVRGERELAARAGQLFADVSTEFVCAGTDLNTWSWPGVRAGIARRMRARLAGGVAVRKLLTPAALADDEQRRHLLKVAAAGAQVRICTATLPHETIVIDRKVMILAGQRTGGDREFTVTASPTLIDSVRSLLEATWGTAVELHAYLGQPVPHLDPEGRQILRALAAGFTDAAAARQIGMSVRTYRRRVADLMRLLESESRFQAGVRAGELGLAR